MVDLAVAPVEANLSAWYHLFTVTMDDLLGSWRSGNSLGARTWDARWHKYFSTLELLGPFGEESWFTVHTSFSWLFDHFFLSSFSISLSSVSFRRRWRIMSCLRSRFALTISERPRYHIPPSPPPTLLTAISAPTCLPFSYDETSLAEAEAKRCCSPVPTRHMLPPPLHRKKRHKKKRKRRVVTLLRSYSPSPPKLRVVPRSFTCAPDIHVNRSSGSFNARDPPAAKSILRVL